MLSNHIGSPKQMSASGAVKLDQGQVVGILCTVSASAILNLYDNSAASGTKIVDTLTLVAGTYYPIPAALNTGLYVELVSGTGKWTVFAV